MKTCIKTVLALLLPVVSLAADTVCNPMDLSYRFQPHGKSRREAADPTVILFKDTYYLFASKSGGYWYSGDMKAWTFVQTDEIPTEEYAPTAIALDDTVYFMASSRKKSTIYKSKDPKSGHWEVAKDELDEPVWDPAFFLDDDDRLYLFFGCHQDRPIRGVELDRKDFSFIGKPQAMLDRDPEKYGWEVRGDYNNAYDEWIFIEGAWLNKYNEKYYLQYAVPGTAQKSYADGVYVADSPLGPYTVAAHNPFAYKPEGFACGAGHGSTFQDKHGNWWHLGTVAVSVKHKFERRLALYPVFWDADDLLYADTRFGDYPMIIPDRKISSVEELFPGWMLLSYRKAVEASSSMNDHPPENLCDEEIRTYWSATSGNDREWILMDLGALCDIHAVQLNFAESETWARGRKPGRKHRYTVEVSNDRKKWRMLIDKSGKDDDCSHDYTQLQNKISARYIRVNNIEVPDGNFAVSGLRIFGLGTGAKPDAVVKFQAERDETDRRIVHLKWSPANGATGYQVRFGIAEDKLYQNYMLYGDHELSIRILNTDLEYDFSIEAFNENGVTPTALLTTTRP